MPISHAAEIATTVAAVRMPIRDKNNDFSTPYNSTKYVVQCAGCGVWLERNFLFCDYCSTRKMQDEPTPTEFRVSELVGYIMDALERS